MRFLLPLAHRVVVLNFGAQDRRGHAGRRCAAAGGDGGLSRAMLRALLTCTRSATARPPVLQGVSLAGRHGRDRGAARPQRRRQVDAAGGDHRDHPATAHGRIDFDGVDLSQRAEPCASSPAASRWCRRAASYSRRSRVEDNLRLGAVRLQRRASPNASTTSIGSFPRLAERRRQRGRHAVGRRAADAGDRRAR